MIMQAALDNLRQVGMNVPMAESIVKQIILEEMNGMLDRK